MSEKINNKGYRLCGSSLYLAFELGNSEWKLGFTVGLGQNPRQRKIRAGDLAALLTNPWHHVRAFGVTFLFAAFLSVCYLTLTSREPS